MVYAGTVLRFYSDPKSASFNAHRKRTITPSLKSCATSAFIDPIVLAYCIRWAQQHHTCYYRVIVCVHVCVRCGCWHVTCKDVAGAQSWVSSTSLVPCWKASSDWQPTFSFWLFSSSCWLCWCFYHFIVVALYIPEMTSTAIAWFWLSPRSI